MAERLAIGAKAPDFSLPGVDGRTYSLASFKDKPVLGVMFTCNHCPYVQAYEDRLIAIQRDCAARGVALVAINANDLTLHPDDDFPHMVERARAKAYNFPYLRDETQQSAEAYGALYTPEIFLFDTDRRLRYTGGIDDNWRDAAAVKRPLLRQAIEAILAGRPVDQPETYAMGCTIKWAK
jgi:peroxiredoxin